MKITIAWLSTIIIKIGKLTFYQDCYGTSKESILLIDSQNYNGLSTVIEAWSYQNEKY